MILVPKQDPIIISSNVPAQDYAEWSSVTTYGLGAYTQKNNKIYKSMIDANLDKDPEVVGDTVWYYVDVSNRLKAFDAFQNTATINANSIEYLFSVSDVDTIGFFGVEATSITVSVLNSSEDVVQTFSYDMTERDVSNWWEWTYNPLEYKSTLIITTLRMLYSAKLHVVITNTGTDAKVAHIVYGRSQSLGLTLFNPLPTTKTINLISKSKGSDGTVIEQNPLLYREITVNVMLDNATEDLVDARLAKRNGKASLFIGDERDGGISALSVYGFHEDFSLPIGIGKTIYQLTIQGVI